MWSVTTAAAVTSSRSASVGAGGRTKKCITALVGQQDAARKVHTEGHGKPVSAFSPRPCGTFSTSERSCVEAICEAKVVV